MLPASCSRAFEHVELVESDIVVSAARSAPDVACSSIPKNMLCLTSHARLVLKKNVLIVAVEK